MQFIFDLPLLIRVGLLMLIGALIGGQINRGIYRLAFHPRSIGPWSPAHPKAPPRRTADRLPIFGWSGLRREAAIHGPWYWLRPLLIEAATAIGLAWLYLWEVVQGGLVPSPPANTELLHIQFLTHALLICLLAVATFIDFDEQFIPDEITVCGTALALLLAAAVPTSRLPLMDARGQLQWLWITTPLAWPEWLHGSWGLGCGVACIVAWCLALLPRLWFPRRGPGKTIQFFFAHILRPPRQTVGTIEICPRKPYLMVIANLILLVIGPLMVCGVWFRGGPSWQSLLTALVGMAFGGGLIWAVRIVGTHALGKEAMGFGDVTLMAMVGAFLGWQPSLIIFFLAPFAALVIAVSQWLFTRKHDIAFGPYLALGALLLIIRWQSIWAKAEPMFAMGWLVPALVVICVVLMAAMLLMMRVIRHLFG